MGALKLAMTPEKIKNFLKLDISPTDPTYNDVMEELGDFITEAAAEAQGHLKTDFHEYDEDGTLIKENPAPPEVNAWVRDRVVQKYENTPAPAPDFSSIDHLRVLEIWRG